MNQRPRHAQKPGTSQPAPSLRRLLVAALERRRPLIDRGRSRMFRAFGGEADGLDGVFVDVYGEGATLIVYEGRAPRGFDGHKRSAEVLEVLRPLGVRAVYLKPFAKDRSKMGGALPAVVTEPTPAAGDELPEALVVREVDWKLEVRLYDGLSTGVFLDQRENRAFVRDWCAARSNRGQIASVLNTFAYTCAFSVAAARGGAETTSVDVSGRYLDWGRRNFTCNGIAVEGPEDGDHRFARMGTFEFFAYARRKGLSYDIVILDPPSFGAASKKDGVKAWSSIEGYAGLVREAAELARPGGLVLASTNTGELCRGGGIGLEKQVAKGLGKKPAWVELPATPVDFAGERDRFAARAFAV